MNRLHTYHQYLLLTRNCFRGCRHDYEENPVQNSANCTTEQKCSESHWVFQHQCCFSGRPPRNWVHSQNRKRTGYWLHSTPKWALWFSAVSHQLSEQCAANKKHFINIPSGRNPLPVNIVPRRVLAPQKIVHSGGSCLQLMGQCWIKWNTTGHITMLTSMFFYSSYYMLMHALSFISEKSVTGS